MLSVHSIRSVFSIILLLAHKAFEINFNPINQKFKMNQFFIEPFTIILRISHLHTDIFLMLSGLLVAQSIIKKRQQDVKIEFFKEISNRYFRLIPTVTALILFVIYILPQLGEGPLWPILIDFNSELCKKTSWWNFLMVQNLMKFEEICMMHTHHIATDFQLSMIGPVVAVGMVAFPLGTSMAMIGSSLLMTIVRFLKAYFEDVSVFISEGRK